MKRGWHKTGRHPVAALLASSLTVAVATSGAEAAYKSFYVNPNGTDSATCGAITAPCKTLQGGIDRAGDRDDVFLQGPADFKPAVVDKSLRIFGAGVFSTDSEPCLTINGGPDTVVTIFDFECHQPNVAYDGIAFTGGRVLAIINSEFDGAGGRCAIRFLPTGEKGRIDLERSLIRRFGAGLCIESQGSNKEITALTTDSRILGNRYGLTATAVPPGHTVRSYNYRTEFSGGGTGVYSEGGSIVTGDGSHVRVLGCKITNNSFLGLEHQNGGLLIDQGENTLADNDTNGTYTSVEPYH
jgi:hypothetical protein